MHHEIHHDDRWRQTHLGRLLGHAMRRFDERVLQLMADDEAVPLVLDHLAARDKVGAAHIHITRHLALEGSRLTELALAAGMSKQAMGDLVSQCEAWGLVRREAAAVFRKQQVIGAMIDRIKAVLRMDELGSEVKSGAGDDRDP